MEFRDNKGRFQKGKLTPFVHYLELGRKWKKDNALTEAQKKERGWYYLGKEKYYWRNCDYCGKEYQGLGESFCSRKCSKLARENIKEKVELVCPECGIKFWDYEGKVYCSKKCFILGRTGEKNYNWIEDRSKLQQYSDSAKDRRSYAYSNWRLEVYKRDNYKCRICNEDCSGRIEAHHILSWREYPELRYDINNGITLCRAHHPRKRAEEKRLVSEFQELVSVSSE